MNKNILVPFSIIAVSLLIGGAVLFSNGSSPSNKELSASSESLRTLELSVPGMFCAGCTASVEGYVSSTTGVKRVQARLSPKKSATVIYDPSLTSKEEIIKNQVFNIYGVSIISDEEFDGSENLNNNKQKVDIPKDIQNKSQKSAYLLQQRLSEGKDVSSAKSFLNQVNNDVERGNFTNANSLLDIIINLLENL